MRIPPRGAIAILMFAVLLLGTSASPDPDPSGSDPSPLTVFLVRHAEKADSGKDPGLTEAGRARAQDLAGALGNAGLEAVHSSDYARTRDTAAPVAAQLGLEVQLYDPRDLPGLASELRARGGRHLVVGHSNTTPALVELLGGAKGLPIDDDNEFDRLYIVTVARDGTVTSVILRYGAASADAGS